MIIALQTLIFFRESLLKALDRLLRPYYKKFSLTFSRNGEVSDDEESDEQVFAEFDDEKGVVFYPPMYLQRYAAVSDCLMDERWCGKLEKVVDLGYHDMSFIKYLKEVPGVKCIMGVDIESIPLRCSSDLLGCDDYVPKRENPLQVTLFQGNASDPDFRLIGCDAVVAIEMIEHMLPHDLDRLVHTVFGFIKPWIVIFTTPNADFNILFKALEKNGLRRWDHFFEWTREQFHDWCSNIVVRYPQYTVSCKGIGPGPSGTLHIGCCSQMALFVAKDYHKQQDLNLNSLALVANTASPHDLNEMIGSWDCQPFTENSMLCPPANSESYTEFIYSDKQSCVTLVLTTPAFSLTSLEYSDKMSQCNLDTEIGRNYLMFDYVEMCCDVLVPRRKMNNRVYVIEDVASRLNCTTLQVNKFSKATQNMMAKNKIDSLVHTREVVDEIRHLTNMLNFNKDSINHQSDDRKHAWYNINWGDNAPYWNQYYKIVREYSYPFETKSDECRILDLISDEINRLLDMQYDEEFSIDVNKLEIPMEHLMRVVNHITDDVDKVKDLLEWNGYEIVDDVVIHSRLVLDNVSAVTHEDDWPENDTSTFSDCDTTDLHSTSMSDGSTLVPDLHGRCLRRALDHKVRKLRTMLTGDEDITTELDRVVCRLMKLALRTSKGRQTPPPTRWMQCKLLDLLTLTEKAIERRKRHFFENYPLRAIDYDHAIPDKSEEMIALEKIREDNTAKLIVDKYRHLVQSLDKTGITEESQLKYRYIDLELEDDLSITSNEFLKDFEFFERRSPSPEVDFNNMFSNIIYNSKALAQKDETKLERTQAWLQDDVEVVPYPNHDINFDNSSGDTDNSTSNLTGYKYKKTFKRHNKVVVEKNNSTFQLDFGLCKRSLSKISYGKQHKVRLNEKNKNKAKPSTLLVKKMTRKKSSYNSFVKNSRNEYTTTEYENYCITSRNKIKESKHLHSKDAKPIPVSLIELCTPEVVVDMNIEVFNDPETSNINKDIVILKETISNVAATEESLFIDIVMEDREETIALRRTIGTDADVDPMIFENETFIRSVTNTMQDDNFKQDVAKDNILTQTIFLYDINEPTTSKGIRHVSMDVQCGPDATVPILPTLSATTSLTKLSKNFKTGIKIGDSITDVIVKSSDFGTSTNDNNSTYKTITPKMRSVGIKIRESDSNLWEKIQCSTMTQFNVDTQTSACPEQSHIMETKMLKPISSGLKLTDSGSEFCGSVGSLPKSPLYFGNSSKITSDVKIESSVSKGNQMLEKISSIKYVRPKLCCGGVHIHSFRDQQESEDVIYQGEWQQYRPKAVTRKKNNNSISDKKDYTIKNRKVNSKEKISMTNSVVKKEIKTELQKPCVVRNTKLTKIKQEAPKKTDLNKNFTIPNSVNKINRPIKTVTKVASKLTMNSISKNTKSAYCAKKHTLVANVPSKKDNEKSKKLQNYMPFYLRKNAFKSSSNNNNNSLDSAKTTVKVNKEKPLMTNPLLVRSKTEGVKRHLLIFNNEPRDISYVVFRNEVDNNMSSASDGQPSVNTKEIVKRKNSTSKRPHSPQSPTSSTCSSPNSIATVRAVSTRPKNTIYRRYPVSSHKTNIANSEPENSTTSKNKKFTKISKSAKNADEKDGDDKENIPETSKKYNMVKKESDKFGKSVFMNRQKSVFIAQLKEKPPLESTVNTLSIHKTQTNKSNVKIPTVASTIEKRKPASPSVSERVSVKSENSVVTQNDKNQAPDTSRNSNMVLVLEPQLAQAAVIKNNISHFQTAEKNFNIEDRSYLSDVFDIADISTINQTSDMVVAIRQLVEDVLDFIGIPFDNCTIDSETVILSRENLTDSNLELTSSPTSFKTVITNDDNVNGLLESEVENALNRTFDTTLGDESASSLTDTRLTVTDFDLLSFKSITSVSKYSEYFLADSELSNSQVFLHMHTPESNSVRDIFERKDQHLIQQNTTAALAVQAFSGFSINAEPLTGDQPDHVNLIDSETGSMAVEINRQATSEELFISSRSSESYESCLIDEDAVVPNWLFNIISQQQSMEDESVPSLIIPMPLPIPIVEPMLDANGNVVDGVGLGVAAGAGDGRGMHSDQSQDSSGRGTSLSSSDTSSGPESEAILIDPSAFVAQFEQLQEAIGSAVVDVLTNPEESPNSLINSEGVENQQSNELGFSHTNNPLNQQILTSDVDADVSSLDTDVPDSSDN